MLAKAILALIICKQLQITLISFLIPFDFHKKKTIINRIMNEVNLFWIMTSTIQNILIIFRNNNDLWTNSTYLGLLKTSVKFLVVYIYFKNVQSSHTQYFTYLYYNNFYHKLPSFFHPPFFLQVRKTILLSWPSVVVYIYQQCIAAIDWLCYITLLAISDRERKVL